MRGTLAVNGLKKCKFEEPPGKKKNSIIDVRPSSKETSGNFQDKA